MTPGDIIEFKLIPGIGIIKVRLSTSVFYVVSLYDSAVGGTYNKDEIAKLNNINDAFQSYEALHPSLADFLAKRDDDLREFRANLVKKTIKKKNVLSPKQEEIMKLFPDKKTWQEIEKNKRTLIALVGKGYIIVKSGKYKRIK